MTIAAPAITPCVQTLIMAGGRGERLYPLTASRPKPAVPFGGVFRIVDFVLSNCINSGLSHVSLLTQYRHKELQSYIQDRWLGPWGEMTRHPLVCLPPRRGNPYRGTADAVFQNSATLRRHKSESVLILSADQVYHMDYRKLLHDHRESNADLTIATVERPLEAAKHFGVVEIDIHRNVVRFQEKPPMPMLKPSGPAVALVSMGVYVFKRRVLMQALRENCSEGSGFDFGHDIIPSLIRSAHIRAYDFRDEALNLPGYWRDIGTIDSYYDTNMDLVSPGTPFDPYANEAWPSYPSRPEMSPRVAASMRNNCRVNRSILSPGVRIEDGGVIQSSVLMSGVSIGRDARIRNSIIEEGIHIPADYEIGFDAEKDRRNHFVSDSGIVVVSQSPKQRRPIVVCVSRPAVASPGVARVA